MKNLGIASTGAAVLKRLVQVLQASMPACPIWDFATPSSRNGGTLFALSSSSENPTAEVIELMGCYTATGWLTSSRSSPENTKETLSVKSGWATTGKAPTSGGLKVFSPNQVLTHAVAARSAHEGLWLEQEGVGSKNQS